MKTILITVSGMSPAIITETVWALSRETPAVIPDEVVVITTVPGRQSIERDLLTPRPEWGNRSVWDCLRQSIFTRQGLAPNSPQLQLSLRVIQLSNPDTGVKREADDVRTPGDNADAADAILQTLSPFVDSSDQRVIASIAGGRKTMGALLYAAMSLIGRESDRVTHVLVNDPYDQCRSFFYPDQPMQVLQARSGDKLIDVVAAAAVVELADIPFVPLRNGFRELDEPRRTFGGLIQRYSTEIRRFSGPPVVSVNAEKAEMTINGRVIKLSTGRVALIARFLWEHAKSGAKPFIDREEAVKYWRPWISEWRQRNSLLVIKWNLKKPEEFDCGDVSNGILGVSNALKEHRLEDYLRFFKPGNSRVGFEIRFPEE